MADSEFSFYERYVPDIVKLGDPKLAIKALVDAVQADSKEIQDLAKRFVSLADPDTCPCEFLPYLASHIGLQLSACDDCALQREQIKQALAWYKMKGTKIGYQIYFRTLGFDIDIIELFEPSPDGFPKALTRIPGYHMSSDINVRLCELAEGSLIGPCNPSGALTEEFIKQLLGKLFDITPIHVEILLIILCKVFEDTLSSADDLEFGIGIDDCNDWICCAFHGRGTQVYGLQSQWDEIRYHWDRETAWWDVTGVWDRLLLEWDETVKECCGPIDGCMQPFPLWDVSMVLWDDPLMVWDGEIPLQLQGPDCEPNPKWFWDSTKPLLDGCTFFHRNAGRELDRYKLAQPLVEPYVHWDGFGCFWDVMPGAYWDRTLNHWDDPFAHWDDTLLKWDATNEFHWDEHCQPVCDNAICLPAWDDPSILWDFGPEHWDVAVPCGSAICNNSWDDGKTVWDGVAGLSHTYFRRNHRAFEWDGNDLMPIHWDIDLKNWDDPWTWDGKPLVWDDPLRFWDQDPVRDVFGTAQLRRDCCGMEGDILEINSSGALSASIPVWGMGPTQPWLITVGYSQP